MTLVHSTTFRATPEVAALMDQGIEFGPYIHKHLNGDWGDISEAERARNLDSLSSGEGHVFSVHAVTPDITVWITTRDGISVVMLPLP